jgi:hypothetical protein
MCTGVTYYSSKKLLVRKKKGGFRPIISHPCSVQHNGWWGLCYRVFSLSSGVSSLHPPRSFTMHVHMGRVWIVCPDDDRPILQVVGRFFFISKEYRSIGSVHPSPMRRFSMALHATRGETGQGQPVWSCVLALLTAADRSEGTLCHLSGLQGGSTRLLAHHPAKDFCEPGRKGLAARSRMCVRVQVGSVHCLCL